MSEVELGSLLDTIFYGYGERRIAKAKHEGRRFVHYTSTEAALSIINNQEFWLRNSAVMNDYSEIAHGEACFRHIFYGDNETRERSGRMLGMVDPGLHERAAQYFEASAVMRRAYTYLVSISEHGPEVIAPGTIDHESDLGRLSMWRAYGSGGGVAIVLNPEPFFNPSNALNAYTSPVLYGDVSTFAVEYDRMLSEMEKNIAAVRVMPAGLFEENLRRFIHFSSLSVKHQGFAEEREWRVTYSADPGNEHLRDEEFNAQSKIKREFRCVNGTPQRIYKIPMRDYPEEGFVGATLAAVLNRIIIGPNPYPMVVYDAFYVALTRAGVPEAEKRLAISNIPLRT